MSCCVFVAGSRSHRRASSWPFLPLVLTAPVSAGWPIIVTPGEVIENTALLVASGVTVLQTEALAWIWAATCWLAPAEVIGSAFLLAKVSAPRASFSKRVAVNGPPPALGVGQVAVNAVTV